MAFLSSLPILVTGRAVMSSSRSGQLKRATPAGAAAENGYPHVSS